jgi:hypothetical protein
VHAGIGPAGDGQLDGVLGEDGQRPLDLSGDRPLPGLLGPPGEAGSVVFE